MESFVPQLPITDAVFTEEIWVQKNPVMCYHIRVKRLGGIYTHHGIYVSDNEVIHFTGTDDDSIMDSSKNRVISSDLNFFLKGGELEVKEYTDEEILFSLCYELAHYIYDSDSSNEYSHTYRIKDIELRAIRFADALLMPLTSFKEAYTELSNNINNQKLLIHALSDTFNAPLGAVERRIKQVVNTKL